MNPLIFDNFMSAYATKVVSEDNPDIFKWIWKSRKNLRRREIRIINGTPVLRMPSPEVSLTEVVETPLGRYIYYKDAAHALGISPMVLQGRIRRNMPGYKKL